MHFDAVVSEGVSKFKGVRMPGESSDRVPGPKAYTCTYRELGVTNSNTMYSVIRKCEQSQIYMYRELRVTNGNTMYSRIRKS